VAMKRCLNLIITLIIFSTIVLVSCASSPTRESTGQYLDNTTITTKVKTKLFADEPLSALPISVKSYKGMVQLSGFVKNQQQADRAVKIARGVPGVRSVVNSLVVRR